MRIFLKFGVITGSALIALVLNTVILCKPTLLQREAGVATADLKSRFNQLFQEWPRGDYARVGRLAVAVALDAEKSKNLLLAGKAWSLAGSTSLVELRLKEALERYTRSQQLAEAIPDPSLIILSSINIAAVYLQLNDFISAEKYALLGLRQNVPRGQEKNLTQLRLQLATAKARQGKYGEAGPLYKAALTDMEREDELKGACVWWHIFGGDMLASGQLTLAEDALTRSLYLARMYQRSELPSVLRKLARLRNVQHNYRAAALLYTSAVEAPSDTVPRWLAYADRGDFRISQHDYEGAFVDFRKARDLVRRLRADVVPNDQGRVNLENGLSRIVDGFIEAGNHLASECKSGKLRARRITETFNVAEADRAISLAALTPLTQDWRNRLPREYWDLLSKHRYLETMRLSLVQVPMALQAESDAISARIGQMEAAAGSSASLEQSSALEYVQSMLAPGDVFLSFHLGKQESWLWVVGRTQIEIISLPSEGKLDPKIRSFLASVHSDGLNWVSEGYELYRALFGKLPPYALRANHWKVEPDGVLFDLPLAALTLSLPGHHSTQRPMFLGEKVALQLSPAAPLLRKGRSLAGGTFVGVGDAIYNAADPRYTGHKRNPPLTLPRLPSSEGEIIACAREYAPTRTTLLTGAHANLSTLLETLRSTPTVLHFATHILPTPGEYHSGLIALSLNQAGDMDVLGPQDIIGHKVEAELIVLNGCHSGQAQTVAGSGLMGLTRAWIGSGANAVLATRWDVPDGDPDTIMLNFYRAVAQYPNDNVAFALRRALQQLLQEPRIRQKPSEWASYFLFART